MKVFISWSGELSKAVAQLLETWLTSVLHATRPWVSTHGIESGSVWFTEVRNQLNETPDGIICMTHENRSAPWIHFEAGALANGLAKNRVCTLLINLKPADVENPMAQYNHTLPTKDHAGPGANTEFVCRRTASGGGKDSHQGLRQILE
jgi:hypothetical protein